VLPADASGPGASTGPPVVSVVVPTHDRRRLLAQTLRSILWQREVDFEVIVVDDGSSDGTAEAVAELGEARVRLLRHETPRGVAAARNRGIAEATGAWLAFCDDDDLWAPDKLARQLQAARATGRSWVYTGEVHVDAGGLVVGGSPPMPPTVLVERLAQANVVPGGCSGVLLRRDALAGEELFDGLRYRHFADWDLWIRLARRGPPAWVSAPLVGYRIHSGNASHDTAGMVAELDVVERRHGVQVDRARFYRYVALLCRRTRRHGAAIAYYVRAALRDRRYLSSGFVDDLTGMAAGAVPALRQAVPDRSGRRRPHRGAMPHQPDHDRQWREAGQAWLRELASGSPTSLLDGDGSQ
jgi:glycosyltransferase involved in cell wall biosynthesis